MTNLYLVFCFLFIASLNYGQTYFPEKCIGKWEGKMVMSANGQPTDTIDVSMEIMQLQDTLGWTWKTVYETPERTITKDYGIFADTTSTNTYLLDENNGIILYSYTYGNKMYSNFMVQGNLLTSVYTLNDDKLIFEITSGKELGKTTNEITNYSVLNVQRSVLYRLR